MSRTFTRDYGLDVAKGNISGTTYVHKFGAAVDFDTGDSPVTIWDGADDANIDAMAYTYSASADIGILSSSNAGDTQTIEVQGLDASYDLNTTSYTLNGQTDVDMSATGTDLIRVFRMKITGSSNNAGHVYVRTNGSTQTLGVPDTANTVRAVIQPGLNQTLMALYTVPNGKKAYVDGFYSALSGANKTAEYQMDLFARPTGEVFQLKNRHSLQDGATSVFNHEYRVPELFAAQTDIEFRCTIFTGGVTAAAIAAGFDLYLVDD